MTKAGNAASLLFGGKSIHQVSQAPAASSRLRAFAAPLSRKGLNLQIHILYHYFSLLSTPARRQAAGVVFAAAEALRRGETVDFSMDVYYNRSIVIIL